MEDHHYVITGYSLKNDRRELVYETEYAILAYVKWVINKFDNKYMYLVMTIRQK